MSHHNPIDEALDEALDLGSLELPPLVCEALDTFGEKQEEVPKAKSAQQISAEFCTIFDSLDVAETAAALAASRADRAKGWRLADEQ